VVDRVIASTPRPPRKIKLPQVTPLQIKPLTIEQVEALMQHAPETLRAPILVQAGSGLRQGELVGLTVDRVDFLRRTIQVDRQLVTPNTGRPQFGPPKTKASVRVGPVPKMVIDAIADHLAQFPSEDLIFKNSHGDPWARRSFLLQFARAVKRAKLPKEVTSHDLRHFYASLLIRHAESVKTVPARLGHASAVETLNTYGHLWDDADDRTREAVELAFANNSRPARGLQAV
jgi:integrase